MKDKTPKKKTSLPFDLELVSWNGVLWRHLHKDHTKSALRDEEYVINSPLFQKAISNGRTRLGITKNYEIPDDYTGTDFVVGLLHWKEHPDTEITDEDFNSHMQRFADEAILTCNEAKLSSSWNMYVQHYLIYNEPPKDKYMTLPKTIEVVGFNKKSDNDKEIVIALRSGLRYEDYRKAWGTFKNTLGDGKRLRKSFADEQTTLQMVNDHENGMSYKEITERYFPNNDPIFNVDRVKKAIQRAKKRYERDT